MKSWKSVVHQKVLVNLLSGSAITGILIKQAGDLLFLRNCQIIPAGTAPLSADGTLVVERSQIEFIQILGG